MRNQIPLKEKIADYFLDISKLVFVGLVLSVTLEVKGVSKWELLFFGTGATLFFAVLGFIILKIKK